MRALEVILWVMAASRLASPMINGADETPDTAKAFVKAVSVARVDPTTPSDAYECSVHVTVISNKDGWIFRNPYRAMSMSLETIDGHVLAREIQPYITWGPIGDVDVQRVSRGQACEIDVRFPCLFDRRNKKWSLGDPRGINAPRYDIVIGGNYLAKFDLCLGSGADMSSIVWLSSGRPLAVTVTIELNGEISVGYPQ